MDIPTIIVIGVVIVAVVTVQIITTARQTERVSRQLAGMESALDGRLTELLKTTAIASRMEGVESERHEARARSDAEAQREHEREQHVS